MTVLEGIGLVKEPLRTVSRNPVSVLELAEGDVVTVGGGLVRVESLRAIFFIVFSILILDWDI